MACRFTQKRTLVMHEDDTTLRQLGKNSFFVSTRVWFSWQLCNYCAINYCTYLFLNELVLLQSTCLIIPKGIICRSYYTCVQHYNMYTMEMILNVMNCELVAPWLRPCSKYHDNIYFPLQYWTNSQFESVYR